MAKRALAHPSYVARAMTPDTPPSRFRRPSVSHLREWLEEMSAEQPVRLAFYVFLTSAAIVIPLSLPFYLSDPLGFAENIAGEAHGMVFDLLVIGWFIFWLQRQGEQRLRTSRYREEIDDFIGWRSAEAALRIAGNVRRLNRAGIRSDFVLTEAFLQAVNLSEAEMDGSQLWGADLTGASMAGVQLRKANLAGATLRGADLEHAVLTGADLRGAELTEADLERAFLEDADLRGANLTAADLQFASLPGARLDRARLTGANLRGAHLENTSLVRAHLYGAHLHGASLDGADLRGADLTRADLSDADLMGALLPKGEELITLFDDVSSLIGAKLDREVEGALRAASPHLFGLQHPEPPAEPALVSEEPVIELDEAELQEADLEGAEEQDVLEEDPPFFAGDGATTEEPDPLADRL